jgi:hypothetical protein
METRKTGITDNPEARFLAFRPDIYDILKWEFVKTPVVRIFS